MQYQDVYRNEEVEEDGKKVTKRVFVERRIVAVKSKDGDNAESLLKQLKIDKDSEQGKQLLKSIGTSGEVRLSALGGEVGKSFGLFEKAITAQKTWTDSGQKGGPPLDGYQNCAETCARLAFPGMKFTGDFYESPAYIDSLLKKQKNLSKSELKFLDAIRYADGENTGTHYANVIFETDGGDIQTFSRSGNGGRLEIRDATSLEGGYGKIQGIGKDKTGFYSRQEKRK